ncbi:MULTISPECIES: glycosyltransferase family 2 protein [unclassified Mycobacterium]|uniref:glycosyltransferase family 2 protein n=1 Tax=unclassified Mycobacterium TaxID=2642494 RepID=UPI0029C7863C|nr:MULTISPECIES: glycosyltransferase [unclassified Mycobacterium]
MICTRDRRAGLLKTLASLSQQSDSRFDVLIVDNSRDGDVAYSWDGFDGLDVRCCHESVPGLSHARNRALSEVCSQFVAWIDDDEVADRDWIAWIKRGFAILDRPDAVAGMMLPAELETCAQVNFERYGGFNKGRGMDPVRLLAGTSVPNPLYPLPSFGAGGNMAFRTDALRAIGGFDNRLGAGTLTHGGEETRVLSMLLERGSLVLHWPQAVTWHYHRRTDAELEKQFFGYSAGLTAFYASMILSSPKYTLRVFRLVFRGLERIHANRRLGRPGGPPADFPEHLLRAGRRGIFQGAWLYLREAVRQWHAARIR